MQFRLKAANAVALIHRSCGRAVGSRERVTPEVRWYFPGLVDYACVKIRSKSGINSIRHADHLIYFNLHTYIHAYIFSVR